MHRSHAPTQGQRRRRERLRLLPNNPPRVAGCLNRGLLDRRHRSIELIHRRRGHADQSGGVEVVSNAAQTDSNNQAAVDPIAPASQSNGAALGRSLRGT